MHDVYVFSTGTTPELIRLNENSKEIVQSNCIRCHTEAVETIMTGVQPYDRSCWSATDTRRTDRAARPHPRTKIHSFTRRRRENDLMNRYVTWILAGLVVLLAVVLAGVLIFLRSQPVQQRSFVTLTEIAPQEPDSDKWGVNFPNQLDTFNKTLTNNIETTYAGSSQFSWLERDPRQVTLFAGYPFSKDYNDDRGHANALEDVRATKRLNLDPDDPKHTPARATHASHPTTPSCGARWAWPSSTR